MAGVRRVVPVTAHMTYRCSTGTHGCAPNVTGRVKELALAKGSNDSMTNRDHQAYTGLDIIDETSAQSFPASDAPSWAVLDRGIAPPQDADRCSDSSRKEESSGVSNSQQDDSAPLFR